MKFFEWLEVEEAIAYALDGGEALHNNPIAKHMPKAPGCFKRSANAAHLFDQDTKRLRATAKRLGVRVVYIDKEGTKHQHLDLCGKPLERALLMCKRPSPEGAGFAARWPLMENVPSATDEARLRVP